MLKTVLLLKNFGKVLNICLSIRWRKESLKEQQFGNNNIDVLNATFDQFNAALLKYLFLKKTKFDTKCIIISIIYCITIIICIFLKVKFLLNFIWVVFGMRLSFN